MVAAMVLFIDYYIRIFMGKTKEKGNYLLVRGNEPSEEFRRKAEKRLNDMSEEE